jgi:hypothetical protein
MIRRAQWPTAVTLGAIALIGLLLQPVGVLRVATASGDALACRAMGRDDRVTLVFTHSMYGGEVRETWRVDGDALARVGIETDTAAAAEYYATDGAVERTGSGFAVIAPPLRLAELPFRIDGIGDHRLRFADAEIALAERVDGSMGATMSARQVPLLARIVDRDAGCGA